MLLYKNRFFFNIFFVLILIIELVSSQNFSSKCIHKKTKISGVCITAQSCKGVIAELENNTAQFCGVDNGHPKFCCQQLPDEKYNGIAEVKCKEYSQMYQNISDRFGLTVNRISGGSNASYGEFPHFALLGYGANPNFSWKCGGSLVSNKFILTAAHCLKDHDQVQVVQLGDVVISSGLSKTYGVKNVYKYPDYTGITTYHDVGLIELSEEIKFSANIFPACLPKPSSNETFPNLIVSGFGRIGHLGETSKILQWTNVQHFSTEDCFPKFQRDTRRLPNGLLDEIQICYGDRTTEKDACEGDSGGPLQHFDRELSLYRVIGIVSAGKDCGIVGVPGIYVNLRFYLHWIESIVWKQDKAKQEIKSLEENPVRWPNNSSQVSKNVTDGYAKPGEFPYAVSVQFLSLHTCEGSILNEFFVLTAANRTYEYNHFPDFFSIQYGVTKSSYEKPNVRNVSKVIIHPEYLHDNVRRGNDIAILQLKEKIIFGDNVGPANLPLPFQEVKVGSDALLLGWGLKTDNKTQLFKTAITVFSDEICSKNKEYRTDLHICAGIPEDGNEQCIIGVGAHLVVDGVQYGILSWSKQGCKPSKENPFYFTKVAKYRDWIQTVLNENTKVV